MFGGNGCINVAVRLVVVRTNPVFRRVLHTYNIYRSRFEPFPVVTFLQLGLVFFRSNHYEFPRLSVTCRRSKACGVENILKIVLAYGLVGKFTGRKTFFAQFQKVRHGFIVFKRLFFLGNLFCAFQSLAYVVADVLFAEKVIESCVFQLGIYFFAYARQHNLYAFFFAHVA